MRRKVTAEPTVLEEEEGSEWCWCKVRDLLIGESATAEQARLGGGVTGASAGGPGALEGVCGAVEGGVASE